MQLFQQIRQVISYIFTKNIVEAMESLERLYSL